MMNHTELWLLQQVTFSKHYPTGHDYQYLISSIANAGQRIEAQFLIASPTVRNTPA